MTLSLGRPETSTQMITTNLAAQWNRLRLCTKAWRVRVRKDNCELFILCSLCKVYRVWSLASLSAIASLGTRGRRRGRAWVVSRVRDNRKNIKYTAAWPCVLCVVSDHHKKSPQLTQCLKPCYSRSDVPSSAVEQNIN